MTELALRHATYEDLLKVPENLVAELIDGDLHTSSRPGSRCARAKTILAAKLITVFDIDDREPGGGWWIVNEPELHFAGNALVPDIAGWRRERVPVYPDAPAFELAPDWLCEVTSPDTARTDRVKKLPLYAKHGVQHVWIVNPVAELIEVYRLESGRWVVAGNYGSDDVVRIEPFEAFEFQLSRLWIKPAEE